MQVSRKPGGIVLPMGLCQLKGEGKECNHHLLSIYYEPGYFSYHFRGKETEVPRG